jgi:hypothetical protein
VRAEYIGASDARAFARVIALLCLVAHAVLVSATHYHLAPQISKKPASACLEARQEDDPNRSPDSDSHNDCLSCRLHRNFVFGIHSPVVLIDLTSGPVIREMILLDPHSSEPFLISASRAPPPA